MFDPIARPSQLPICGAAFERAALDFKAIAPQDRFEAAKDVAAFANGEGGTLLVGAAAQGELLSAYLPLTEASATDAQRLYEEAVRDRCRPAPIFTVERIPKDAGIVVAINVWPFAGQAVGVELKKQDLVRQLEGVFVYPVRVGTHTKSILPEQMPMFIDAKFRRVAFVLRQAVGGRISLFGRQGTAAWFATAKVISLDELGNTMRILLDVGEREVPFVLPIDLIEMAWLDDERVKLALPGYIGTLQPTSGSSDELKDEQAMFFAVDKPRPRQRPPRELRVHVTHFPHAATALAQVKRAFTRMLQR